jgi:hypothetical protein
MDRPTQVFVVSKELEYIPSSIHLPILQELASLSEGVFRPQKEESLRMVLPKDIFVLV